MLVPTMGALHAGHAALIRQAAALAGPAGAVATIFVNPTQFNDPADLAAYPRTEQADVALCRDAGAAAVYLPGVEDVYPPDQAVPVGPLPAVATEPGLEDAHRPGHFAGVCQVVRRLFALTRPAAAVFGEKDWQQLAVIRAIVRDEGLGIRIHAGPTVREADGLAMSSRNTRLGPEDRARAAAIPLALREAGFAPSPEQARRVLGAVLDAAGLRAEYAVVRDADTLLPPTAATAAHRMLVAAPVGRARLIDNAPWPWDGA